MVSRKNRMADRLRLLPRLFGFLLGSTLAGASVYYYILEEYKVSNELLTEDIYVRWPLVSFLGRMELDARHGDGLYTWDTAGLLSLAYHPRLCYRKANANPATTGTASGRATDSLLRDGTGEQDEPDEEMSIDGTVRRSYCNGATYCTRRASTKAHFNLPTPQWSGSVTAFSRG
jgi:hypothetical protein